MNSTLLNCTTHSFPLSPLPSPHSSSLQAPFFSFVPNHWVQFTLPYECGCGDFLWDMGDCQHHTSKDKWLQLEHVSWTSNLGPGNSVAIDMWILTHKHTHQLFILYLSIQRRNSVSHTCTANSTLPASRAAFTAPFLCLNQFHFSLSDSNALNHCSQLNLLAIYLSLRFCPEVCAAIVLQVVFEKVKLLFQFPYEGPDGLDSTFCRSAY